MANIILSINAGSSSVKVSVYTYAPTSEPASVAEIQISGLTAPPATLKYDRGDEHTSGHKLDALNRPQAAFHAILDHLTRDKGLPQLNHPADIVFACHRVVHGGDYNKPVRIDSDAYHHLEALSALAPLHNAGALDIVKAVHEAVPSATNVAFFDNAFHSTLAREVRTYAIDPKVAERNKLRKYGFHGLSYAYITRAVAAHLHKPENEVDIIALHLGSGASACCIRQGRSYDTSMGLTPLAGLPGATRSGDVDPSLIFHFTHGAGNASPQSTKEMHITQAEEILNKKSGWSALAGTTDFGTISSQAEQGEENSKLAFDIFVDRIVGFVGSYYAKLAGRVDALVFAGGIGEKGVQLRRAVVAKVSCLGFGIDEELNEQPGQGKVVDIGTAGARHAVLLCRTDEQAEMARQCALDADELRRPS